MIYWCQRGKTVRCHGLFQLNPSSFERMRIIFSPELPMNFDVLYRSLKVELKGALGRVRGNLSMFSRYESAAPLAALLTINVAFFSSFLIFPIF